MITTPPIAIIGRCFLTLSRLGATFYPGPKVQVTRNDSSSGIKRAQTLPVSAVSWETM